MKQNLSWLALLLALAFFIPAPACKTVDAATTPQEVVQTTVLRGTALAALEFQLEEYDDDQLADALLEDAAAWAYVEEATGFVTPTALKQVAQSQKIAVKVAAGKIRSGGYTNEQKRTLVRSLRKAWDGLSSYYNPPTAEE